MYYYIYADREREGEGEEEHRMQYQNLTFTVHCWSTSTHFWLLPCNSSNFYAICTTFYDFFDKAACYISIENCQLLVINSQVLVCIFLNHHQWISDVQERFVCSLPPWVCMNQ